MEINGKSVSWAVVGLFLLNLILLGAGAFVVAFLAHLGWNMI